MTGWSDNSAAGTEPARRPRWWAFVLGLSLGLAGGLLGLMLCLLLFLRDPLPRIEAESLSAARARWQAEQPRDYELKLELTGNQSGRLVVQVRDGRPYQVQRQPGQSPPQRTWDYWTVPGLFDVIEGELGCAADAAKNPSASPIVVRGEFDARYGYPARFRRTTLGGGAQIGWRVLSFEPVFTIPDEKSQ
jgi:hypothetical protein